MKFSNYPPGVTGNEPQITGEIGPLGWPAVPETGRSEPDAPGFILVCTGCGEEFDALQPAVSHIMDGMAGDHDCDEETTFQIMPEEMSSYREEPCRVCLRPDCRGGCL